MLSKKQKLTFDEEFGMMESRRKMYAAVEAVLALERPAVLQKNPNVPINTAVQPNALERQAATEPTMKCCWCGTTAGQTPPYTDCWICGGALLVDKVATEPQKFTLEQVRTAIVKEGVEGPWGEFRKFRYSVADRVCAELKGAPCQK